MSNYLTTLVAGQDPKIDIVAVHGLNPGSKSNHGRRTWAVGEGDDERLWLRDFLPSKVPEARIFLFGYDSSVINGSKMHLMDHAKNLLNRLESKRAAAPERPILFIAHSLGGLVVKQAMVEARKTDNPICVATYGMMFFATPHRGGNMATFGTILSNIINISMRKPPSKLVEALRKDSAYLEQLDSDFREQLEDFFYVNFRDQRPVDPFGIIVDDRSAQLGLPFKRERSLAIDRDHKSICKFATKDDADYEQVEDEVKRMVKDAVNAAALRAALRTPSQSHRSSVSRFSSPNLFGSLFSSPTLASKTDSTDKIHSKPIRVFGGVPTNHEIGTFVGRQDLLLRLINKLTASDMHNRLALYGLGGVGKTALALKCAYEIKTYATDISVLWISADSADHLQQSIMQIAQTLDITHSGPIAAVLESLRSRLEDSDNGRWVLIVDSVNDFQTIKISQVEGKLTSYIPNCLHGAVLLTTRDRKIATEFSDKKGEEKVSALSHEDSVELLYELLDSDHIQDGTGVHELVRLLEYFPQTIVQAASFMRKNDINIKTYLTSFSENKNGTLELLGHGFEDSSNSKAITTLWAVSFEQLRIKNKYAADLLSLMAFLHPSEIPESVLLAIDSTKSPAQFIQACGSLKALSFISESPLQGTITPGSRMFHVLPMVQTVIQHWIEQHDDVENWCGTALVALSKVLDAAEGSKDQWEAYKICLPHVQAVNKHMVDSTAHQELRATLLHQASSYFRIRAVLRAAEEMVREAIMIRTRFLGCEDEKTLASMHSLALVLSEQNRLREAEDIELQAIETCTKAFGGEHNHTLRHQATLACIWGIRGKYQDALKLQQSIFDTTTAIDSKFSNPGTWSAMRDLAISLCYVGRRNEAKSLQLQVYKARSENLGTSHPETLIIMSDLATSYIEDSQYEEAKGLLQEVLPNSRRILGERHPKTVTLYENYRFVLKKLGDNKSMRVLDEVIRRMQRDERSNGSGFEKPDLKRAVSDSVVNYDYRTTQMERASRRKSSAASPEAQGLGLTLTQGNEIILYEADEEEDLEEEDPGEEEQEYATIKKALVMLTRWAGTLPLLDLVSDALSDELTTDITSAKPNEPPSSQSATTSPDSRLEGSTVGKPTPSQFEPLTRIPTFNSDTNLSVASSPELVTNYSTNRIVRSVQKKVERNANKETLDYVRKTGLERIQDAKLKFDAANFKGANKISFNKPWASSTKDKKYKSEEDTNKKFLETPEEKLMIEGRGEQLLIEDVKDSSSAAENGEIDDQTGQI